MRIRRSVIGAVLAAMFLVAGCSTPTPAPTPAPAPTPSASAAPAPSATASPEPSGAFLWPFPDAAAARRWQGSFAAGGGEPWHLDADATALGFVQGYLAFGDIELITSREGAGRETWIGVGQQNPAGRPLTAAVLHLQRVGAGEDAPWEVVGTRDTRLTIDSPAYGSRLAWPLAAGGVVTGVDESLHVRVLGANGLVAEACCTPAGGEGAPWRAAVPEQGKGSGTTGGTLTVVVSTGGHIADVEAFAITAVTA